MRLLPARRRKDRPSVRPRGFEWSAPGRNGTVGYALGQLVAERLGPPTGEAVVAPMLDLEIERSSEHLRTIPYYAAPALGDWSEFRIPPGSPIGVVRKIADFATTEHLPRGTYLRYRGEHYDPTDGAGGDLFEAVAPGVDPRFVFIGTGGRWGPGPWAAGLVIRGASEPAVDDATRADELLAEMRAVATQHGARGWVDDGPRPSDAPVGSRFYARWGPPDDYAVGTRLRWPGSGPLLGADPVFVGEGWPGLPTAIWRVVDVHVTETHADGRVRGGAFTIAERLPSWRWLGERGDELLAVIADAVETARLGDSGGVPSHAPATAPSQGPGSTPPLDPAARTLANFRWLLRHRLLEEAKARDPGSVAVFEDFGCGGPIHEEQLTGRWAEAEAEAILTARSLVSPAGNPRS